MKLDKNKILFGGAAAFFLYAITSGKNANTKKVIINNIVDQLEKNPNQIYTTRSASQINKIIVHHYASNGTPQAIAHYHVKPKVWINKTPLEWNPTTNDYKKKNIGGNEWPGIGYHFTINKDGTISQVNNIETISYHVAGQNTSAIGVALEGNFQNSAPTAAQLASLDLLIPFIRKQVPQNLQVYGHSDFNSSKPYDPNFNLNPYKIAGVFAQYAPGLNQCQDGSYTDLTGQGSCANHGGIYDPLKDITEADLETYFYKDYNLALYLAAEKVDPISWNRYGDSQLSKEKFMWLKKGGVKLDLAAQEMENILNIPIEPQDFIDIIMLSDNPYTFINDLKEEILDIFKRQGIGQIVFNSIKKGTF